MNKRVLMLILISLFARVACAQTRVFENVNSFELRNAGKIMDQGNILGYYFFYKKDLVDEETEAFKITLMDNNLSVMNSFDVVRPLGSQLVETAYNGVSFLMVYFHDLELEFVAYDKAGKVIGNKKLDYIPDHIQAQMKAAKQSAQDVISFYALDSSSFFRHSVVMNKNWGVEYELEGYSNSMKSLWKVGSQGNSEEDQIADIKYVSGNYIAAVVGRTRRGDEPNTFMTDSRYQVLDAKTGAMILETPLNDSGSNWMAMYVFLDEEQQRSMILGMYSPFVEKAGIDMSMGLYTVYIDMKGNKSNLRKYPWEGDLGTSLKEIYDSKSRKKPSVFFHTVYRSKTGKTIAIGEQYRLVASALGMAGMSLNNGNGGRSMCDLKLMNMVVLEFDSSNNIIHAVSAEKKRHNVAMPPWIEMNSLPTVARIMGHANKFDFQFASVDKARDRLYAVYLDADRKGENDEMANIMLGVISYENGKSNSERIPLNTEAKYIWVDQAKPGYMLIGEYFKKKKQISYRLEKINY